MSTEATAHDPNFNYGYLDEQTKRMVRRAILKAIAIPGYQVPFAAREMPMPYGWGTGGVQVTASIIGPADTLKVIDQGADDTTNATSIRRFFRRVTGVRTTESTREATIIQTRHRIPETPTRDGQVIVFQAPEPEAMRLLEPRETETRKLHAFADYGLMHVKLYDDVSRTGHIAAVSNCPVLVNGRYLMSPTPIPSFDNAKLHISPAMHLFGAGRERRIYALPPYTRVDPVEFEDKRFVVQRWSARCSLCDADESYLDEIVVNDAGKRIFTCSDTNYCRKRQGEVQATLPLGDARRERARKEINSGRANSAISSEQAGDSSCATGDAVHRGACHKAIRSAPRNGSRREIGTPAGHERKRPAR